MAESHLLGREGEEQAAEHLKSKGYKILHRNWVSGRRELDIVAENKEYVVFVEVKTRAHDFHMPQGEMVTKDKQRSMVFAADSYIRRYNINKESRFDVITIISTGKSIEIEHTEGAFYPTLR